MSETQALRKTTPRAEAGPAGLRHFADLISQEIDGLLRARIVIGRRPFSAFQVCGCAGVIIAAALGAFLALRLGLAVWVIGALLAAAALAFLEVVIVTKILTGRETLVYYHHEIAALLHAALILRILRQPMLPYLDITALGIGCFLAFGRTGCLLVGCCHGRPARTGIHYRQDHADAGFSPLLVGVPLVPVQAVEVVWVLLTVLAGAGWVITGSRPGEAFAWYIAAYGIGRFCLEYWRGDPDRRQWGGTSEAQWISLLSVGFLLMEELEGRLPFHLWHAATAVLFLGLMALNATRQKRSGGLTHPKHVREIAQVLSRLARVPDDSPAVMVLATSQGIRISTGTLRHKNERTVHYTLSRNGGSLSPEAAETLAQMILRLRRHADSCSVVQGRGDVFHVVVGSSGALVPRDNRVEPVALALARTAEKPLWNRV